MAVEFLAGKKAPKVKEIPKAREIRLEKKEKAATPMDLDMDMDKYWFEAGKGPNPVVASLDREMDDYFKSKSEKAAAVDPST
mmetsp:Transcript_12631/g.18984  ORF Transcript_12631/g.18984 Transcript_12631/m.18984 type:complete len:82 (+) Transcript_12631:250-495(+)